MDCSYQRYRKSKFKADWYIKLLFTMLENTIRIHMENVPQKWYQKV